MRLANEAAQNERVRCFLALELPAGAREHLVRVQDQVREIVPRASLPRSENLHVTLKFLGDVQDRLLPALCESLQLIRIAGDIDLRAQRLDCFPSRNLARVIVASMSGGEGPTVALHAAVEQRCRKLGFDAENRKYHPHVTLARPRMGLKAVQTDALAQSVERLWPGPTFAVREFVLFESRLHAEGSRYIKLASFSFGG